MSIDPLLFQKGFTLQAALEVPTVAIGLPEVAGDYNQLLVFGHAGSGFWKSMEEPLTGSDPLDRMSMRMVEDFLQRVGCEDYLVLYPSTGFRIDLRALGKQLGWHADSALGIGVNAIHGTWFAYRVVVLANTFMIRPRLTIWRRRPASYASTDHVLMHARLVPPGLCLICRHV